MGSLLLLLSLLATVGCEQPSDSGPACAPAPRSAEAAGFRLQICGQHERSGVGWRRVQDLRTGKVIELPAPPGRVVSQTLATDEFFADLLGEQTRARLVAVSAFAASPRYSDLGDFAEAVGTIVTNKTEEILALRPDLVFAASYSTAETVQQLEGAGVPTVVLHRFDSVDAIRDNLRVVAFAMGLDDEGHELEKELDEKIERATAHVRQSTGDTAPRAIAYGSGSAHAKGTLMDDLLGRFGLLNPASEAGLSAWPTINEEHLLDWRPNVVFLSAPEGREDRVVTLFRNRFEQLASSSAPPRLVTVPETSWSTVSHRVGDLALQLAAAFVDGIGPTNPAPQVD